MKIKQKLLSIILMISIIFGMTSNVFAKDTKPEPISDAKLESTIEGMIKWAKQGHEKLLNPEFLEMVGTTPGDWFPIGMGRYGYKDDYGAYLSAIEKNVTERYKSRGKLHPVKATEWHRISLAILAMGGDPAKMGKDPKGNPINLIADGSYNCVGRRGVKGQGINGAIWSLISLDSLRYDVPKGAKYTREGIIKLILEEQLSDGGFSLNGDTADPDITAMAMQALAPYYNSDKVYTYECKNIRDGKGNFIEYRKTVRQVMDECINIMSKMQKPDGDYFSWGTQNVESTVQVLTALCSLGIDCEKDPRFIKGGKTLIDGIMKYRNDRDGGFLHSYTYDPANPSSKPDASNSMATEQTLYGLVAHWRLRNNKRNLYDFRPETNQNEFIIKGNDNKYTIPFKKDQQVYSLELQSDVKEFSFTNIPMGPYDTSNISLNFKRKSVDGDKIQIEIKNRQNEIKKYKINISITDQAKINNIIGEIENLPQKITLEHDKKIKEINEKIKNLNKNEKKKITNIKKLNVAEEKLNDLKKKLEKENSDKQKYIWDNVNELPSIISIADKSIVSELSNSLNTLGDFDKKKEIDNKLKIAMKKIEKIEAEINKLDECIFKEINPMNVTLSNKDAVLELISKYEKLNKRDREYVQNYHDVLFAQKVIYELERNKTIVDDVFKNIIGSDEVYTFNDKTSDGKNYAISFKGTDITDPTINFNANISSKSKNDKKIKKLDKDATIISFAHEGKLPGKAQIIIDVNLKDGEYFLYYFNEKTGKGELVNKIDVKDGKAIFKIDHCSDYFISANSQLKMNNDSNKSIKNSKNKDIEVESSKLDNGEIESPKTGDNSIFIPLVILFICSGVVILILKKKSISKM